MTPIDERSRRLSDEPRGEPIVLPDGQTWTFFEPDVLAPGDAPVPRWTFGAEVAPGLDAALASAFDRVLAKIARARSEVDSRAAMLESAWFCLARNYEVSRDEFEAILLAPPPSGFDLAAMGEAMFGVVSDAMMRRAAAMRPMGMGD